MGNVIQGELLGQGKKFAIVISRFNEFITSRLLSGAQDCFERHGVAAKDVDVAWVPGSFEIPVTALRIAQTHRYDAVVCLGAVIRGQTPHFDYIAAEVSKGVAQVAMVSGVPTIFGVITSDTIEQAVERAGTKSGNKGADAAASAIEMANLFGKLPKGSPKK
jgi:6,7-dimethyl-8-ribityllumazine synthase